MYVWIYPSLSGCLSANEVVHPEGIWVEKSIWEEQVSVGLYMIMHQNNESLCVLSSRQGLVRREDRNRWSGLWTNNANELVREWESDHVGAHICGVVRVCACVWMQGVMVYIYMHTSKCVHDVCICEVQRDFIRMCVWFGYVGRGWQMATKWRHWRMGSQVGTCCWCQAPFTAKGGILCPHCRPIFRCVDAGTEAGTPTNAQSHNRVSTNILK